MHVGTGSPTQAYMWVELKIYDPGNLNQKIKKQFPLILPHELYDYLSVPPTAFSNAFGLKRFCLEF